MTIWCLDGQKYSFVLKSFLEHELGLKASCSQKPDIKLHAGF